jgi:uncharacterized protein (TIRG00374 family)
MDLAEVSACLARLGWGILPVLGISFLWHLCCTLGWRASFCSPEYRPPLPALFRAKLSGEAIASLAPAPQIGSEVAKAFLTRARIPSSVALPAQVINKAAEIISGILFLLAGLTVALVWLPLAVTVRAGLAVGAIPLVLVAGLLIAGGRTNALGRLLALGIRLGLPLPAGCRQALDRIGEQIARFHRQGWRQTAFLLLLHLLCWLLGVVEVYAILHLIGSPASPASCFVFRALLLVVTSVFCFVPFGAGVFEAGHLLLFSALGVGPSVAASVAVVRRLRKSFWMAWGGLLPLLDRSAGR